MTGDGEPPLVVATERPGLVLKPLGIGDLDAYYTLIDRNREHLNQRGDYPFEAAVTRAELAEWLSSATNDIRFGIWLDGELVGRTYVGPMGSATWAIGYWLGAEATGRGIATMACRATIRHARGLGATEIRAQITRGNDASVAVVARLGFEHVRDVEDQALWRLALPSADG